MTTLAIDTNSNVELEDLVSGLNSFIAKEVVPLEESNQALLEDGRRHFDERGGYSTELLALLRQVRESSAQAGFYAMFAPASVGGGGLGLLPLFAVWEGLSHAVGPGRLLPYEAIGHWTSGPSFLLGELQ